MILLGSLQLIYWKLTTGRWLYYSYEEGEKVRLFAPYLIPVLFSFKKGWLVYTPLMIFSILGLYSLYKKTKEIY
jgi:hypothetical protein